MGDDNALRKRRSRRHRADDHSLCTAERCPALGGTRTKLAPTAAPALAVAAEPEPAPPPDGSGAGLRRLCVDASGLSDRDLVRLGDLLHRAATHRAASAALSDVLADLARQVLGARRNIDTRETH
jgi:hypothetical protein